MDGLEPLAEWLEQSTWDWADPFFDAPLTERAPDQDGKGESTELKDKGVDEGLFDWPWESCNDAAVTCAPASDAAVVDAQKWRDETKALRDEILRLHERVRSLTAALEDCKSRDRRMDTLEQQNTAMMKWSADVSVAINNMQLQQEGLSPLQRHFGIILGARLSKGTR